jgi:cytochrome c oxidase cbb3-type subunit II
MNHAKLEKNIGMMMVFIVIAISFGGLAEVVPLMWSQEVNEPVSGLRPLTPLELEGRDVYIREGCNVCHTQMIRPFRAETERYGHYSVAGEHVYEHPFLWGSKRTGPDLARVGKRYSDEWHRTHLINPRDVVPESNMPGYPWLESALLDDAAPSKKMQALAVLGVPYQESEIQQADQWVKGKSELDALVAYLQQLGTHLGEQR